MQQRTLSIIKPDAVAKHGIGPILARIEKGGLRVVAGRFLRLSRSEAEVAPEASHPPRRPRGPRSIERGTSNEAFSGRSGLQRSASTVVLRLVSASLISSGSCDGAIRLGVIQRYENLSHCRSEPSPFEK